MEMDTTYTPPTIISGIDDDIIHARMLSALPSDIDKTDGGFAHDFTRPAALEKAELMIAINDVMQVFFPAWSYGGYLDELAAGVGLSRRSAQAAEVVLEITGVEGIILPAGFMFATAETAISDNVEFEVKDTTVINSEGKASVTVRCTQIGTIGNVPENSITLMVSPIGGIATITNPKAATGGVEDEDDDSLRERIKEREQSSESSFVGNNADYKRWAKEVDGVGTVVVVPEWMGPGSGTVKLIVMDANGAPANDTIQEAVYNHIMSPDDEDSRLAPIGAILIVTTASPTSLDISATVILESGAEIADVTAAYRTRLLTYFEEAKAESMVYYTRIASVLSETPGIVDYTDLLLNDGISNIPITVDDYPTITTLVLREGS